MGFLHADGDPACPHCALAEAALAFMESEGGAVFVAANRDAAPQATGSMSDEQILRNGLARALGIVMADLMEDSAPDDRLFMEIEFRRMLDYRQKNIALARRAAVGRA